MKSCTEEDPVSRPRIDPDTAYGANNTSNSTTSLRNRDGNMGGKAEERIREVANASKK